MKKYTILNKFLENEIKFDDEFANDFLEKANEIIEKHDEKMKFSYGEFYAMVSKTRDGLTRTQLLRLSSKIDEKSQTKVERVIIFDSYRNNDEEIVKERSKSFTFDLNKNTAKFAYTEGRKIKDSRDYKLTNSILGKKMIKVLKENYVRETAR